MTTDSALSATPHGDARFRTTCWSAVLSAADSDTALASSSLNSLCEWYWFPVYAYARRTGSGPDEAQDLAQGFFLHLIEKRDFSTASPQRGRFRSYLLASFRHYMSNQRDRAQAQKRGGGETILPLDFSDAEKRYLTEPADNRTPEKLYERRWVMALLERVLGQLRSEFEADRKLALFDAIKPVLTGEGIEKPYREVAAENAMSESAVKVFVHRLRQRYKQLLREAVADTVATPGECEDEIQFLFTALE